MTEYSPGIISMSAVEAEPDGCDFCGTAGAHASWCLNFPDRLTFSLTWVGDAICKTEEMFAQGRVKPELLKLCEACPVRRQCGEYGVATKAPHGIWGGLTPENRQDILAGVTSLEEALR